MDLERPAVTRRSLLTALPAVGLSGCSGLVGSTNPQPTVSILAAGSLYDALENGLRERVGTPIRVEAHGSVQVARLVAGHQKDPDIVAVADDSLFESLLTPDWYAKVATNAIVLAYDDQSAGGRRIADAGDGEWLHVLRDEDIALGRTDPDLDPLGYRTLFTLELAAQHYQTDTNVTESLLDPDQVYPETQLLSQFETGSIDAAFVYRSMAVERDYEFLDLPAQIDLSDPSHTDRYRTTRYTLPDGRTITGDLISYAATIRKNRPEVVSVFEELLTGDALTDFGFTVPDDYPQVTPHAPDEFAH